MRIQRRRGISSPLVLALIGAVIIAGSVAALTIVNPSITSNQKLPASTMNVSTQSASSASIPSSGTVLSSTTVSLSSSNSTSLPASVATTYSSISSVATTSSISSSTIVSTSTATSSSSLNSTTSSSSSGKITIELHEYTSCSDCPGWRQDAYYNPANASPGYCSSNTTGYANPEDGCVFKNYVNNTKVMMYGYFPCGSQLNATLFLGAQGDNWSSYSWGIVVYSNNVQVINVSRLYLLQENDSAMYPAASFFGNVCNTSDWGFQSY
jgi:hypothetical protein